MGHYNPHILLQGRACNMTKPAQVASLADFAHDELGSIDLWCVPCPALPCPALPPALPVYHVQCELAAQVYQRATCWLAGWPAQASI